MTSNEKVDITTMIDNNLTKSASKLQRSVTAYLEPHLNLRDDIVAMQQAYINKINHLANEYKKLVEKLNLTKKETSELNKRVDKLEKKKGGK